MIPDFSGTRDLPNLLISFANDGVPNVVRPGETGLLAPPEDAKALRDGIGAFLHEAAVRKRLGREGR